MKTIAVVNTKETNLREAIMAVVSQKYRGDTVVYHQKITEAPGNASLAGLGIPSWCPGTEPRHIISVGTRICNDDAERAHQWDVIRDPNSSVEEIMAELGGVSEYIIIPAAAATKAKMEFGELRIALAELKSEDDVTPEDRAARELEIYKKSFDMLKKQIL